MSQGYAGVVPFGYSAGGRDSYENVVALRWTGLDQPVNCVLGAAYPGIPYEEDNSPRTESGHLINSVVRTPGLNGLGVPGDNDGTPRTGFAKPGNGVVHAPGPGLFELAVMNTA